MAAYRKYRRGGQVGILVSPGYGAGWSTWAHSEEVEGMLYDADIIEALLAGERSKALAIAEERYPESYKGGFEQLKVRFVCEGDLFYVREYDGCETVEFQESKGWHIA